MPSSLRHHRSQDEALVTAKTLVSLFRPLHHQNESCRNPPQLPSARAHTLLTLTSLLAAVANCAFTECPGDIAGRVDVDDARAC
jgi:hypothetical protein